ncbi:tetratricopeptide repeat protein [Prochlorococcus sp. MIT 0801]|uniref:tetratricopeptide repeat protein n=1 Tax=Prochlorococcus sp. MIT 0801 TaxID=1501269 RepID=UPI0004F702E3|nr:tetratricopeptide repeat protein [Prochlorococcus sp. MIT 0801]AIQ98131.1 Translation elongation factor P [Prochlorococcus sp. MIT 0801]
MESIDKDQGKNKITKIKIYPVPYELEEIKENLTIVINTSSKDSKQQVINQAFNFHSKGNIAQALKYYQQIINQGSNDYRVFYNYGLILKDLGKVKEAEVSLRRAIEINPDFANAYLSLGNLLRGLRNFKDAEIYTRKAIEINPNFAEAHSNLGSILQDIGKLKEAEASLHKAIELNTNVGEVHYNLGIILKDLGKIQESEKSTRKAIKINPNFANAHMYLGTILKDLGKLKEAEKSTRKAIEINPNFANAHMNLGTILKDLDKLQEAEISTRKAIDINPNSAEVHYNLGIILKDLGKLKEAEKSTRKAIEINPNFAVAHNNLGDILRALGNIQKSELSIRKAIEINPNLAFAHLNLGRILVDLDKLKEAELSTKKAIELKPELIMAHFNLGIIFINLGKYDAAINCYKKAIKLNNSFSPAKVGLLESKKDICDWSDQKADNTWIKTLGFEGDAVIPFPFFFFEDNPLKDLKRAQNFYKQNFKQNAVNLPIFKNKRIHIGYFSSDFKDHATMHLIASIFELHDKSKFKIYLYSFTPREDIYTERAKQSGCFFRDIKNLNTIEAVELARRDRLDIAIDLKGYTKHSRMNIFSSRVAPIQINYLGYPGSLGAETIDYIIADNILIPKEKERFYSEKIIRMPNCYQCNDNKKEISKESISRRDFKLPDKGFIFTCFNSNKKISPKEFDIWMRLLKEVKGSVLWLYKSNTWAIQNLCKEAEIRNIDSDRLFFANKLPLEKHLARYSLGDLALDTFNCNGHTTTSDALWAGLPVLTKIGESFSARVSASLLTSLGIPELITHNEKEYEEKAIHIANNPDVLKNLKSQVITLRNKSPLFNSKLFTKNLESKFLELVK